MKIAVKIIAGLVGLFIVVFLGLSIFISTLDADKYRPRIVEEISKATGRTAKLNGPITFSLGFSGVKISIQDASISNPSWASRPTMAGMGKFEMAVGVLPLLTHEVQINQLNIENADILLETNAEGQHNWDFTNVVAEQKPVAVTPEQKASSPVSGSLNIQSLKITNSQLALRGVDGKLSSYNVASLDLNMAAAGANVAFKGDANGTPITLNVKTSISNLLSQAPFAFDSDLSYAAFHVTTKGKADLGSKSADITAYEISAGSTKIDGKLSAKWGGARPALNGTLTSDKITMSDFAVPAAGGADEQPVVTAPAATAGAKPIFSTTALPLDELKAVDAAFDVAVEDFPLGKGELKKISAKMVLSGGDLVLAPVKAYVGAVPVDVQVKLDASQSPAHLTMGVISQDVDLGDLQKLGGMAPFMTGKAGANIQLAGDGRSAHDIASSLGGIIVITAEKGEILTGVASGISSALATVFNPQGGDSALNCLAARFIVKNGIMNDNGILIDSAASTVQGKGNVNLATELVDLNLQAKTKLVDVGGLVPPLHISGPLNGPHYSVDAVGTVKNAVGALLGGTLPTSSGVPDIQAAPAGQNACVYTLDHPKAATSNSILPSSVGGKASQQIQNISNGLRGLFGK